MMDLDEAMAMGMEFAPGDGRGPEALHVLAAEVERLRAIETRAVEMAEFVLPPDDKDYSRATAEADVAAMILERTPAYLAEVGKRLGMDA